MVKKTKEQSPTDTPITLTYDLPSLPSAQHKAGLAGLWLTVEAMRRKGISEIPVVDRLTQMGLTITFTQKTLQSVFDELYDASWEETRVKSKWPGAEPIRIDEEISVDPDSGKEKREKRFVYSVVVPKLDILTVIGLADKSIWMKLWRDMIWSVLRSQPTTRGAYEDRANGDHAERSGIGGIWSELIKQIEYAKKGNHRTVKVSGSLLVGAQQSNAEKVSFEGPADQTLLLHFWLLCSLIYVSQSIDRDGKTELDSGYILAVPEISRLIDFVQDYQNVLGESSVEAIGYRPKDSVISIPEEGGLDYLRLLVDKAAHRVKSSALRDAISAVEVVYLTKKGNSVSVLSNHRLEPDPLILKDFDSIRRSYTNPMFRAHHIRNIIRKREWFEGFSKLAATMPAELFVNTRESPWIARQFCADARKAFKVASAD